MQGADPNKPFTGQLHSASMCCDTKGTGTPFYRAAVAADVEGMKLMIAHGADLEWSPKPSETDGPRGGARQRECGQDAADGGDGRRQGRRHGRRPRRHSRRARSRRFARHPIAIRWTPMQLLHGGRRQGECQDAGWRFGSAHRRVRRQARRRPRARGGRRRLESQGRQGQDRARRSWRNSRRDRRRPDCRRARERRASLLSPPRWRRCCASSCTATFRRMPRRVGDGETLGLRRGGGRGRGGGGGGLLRQCTARPRLRSIEQWAMLEYCTDCHNDCGFHRRAFVRASAPR